MNNIITLRIIMIIPAQSFNPRILSLFQICILSTNNLSADINNTDQWNNKQ